MRINSFKPKYTYIDGFKIPGVRSIEIKISASTEADCVVLTILTENVTIKDDVIMIDTLFKNTDHKPKLPPRLIGVKWQVAGQTFDVEDAVHVTTDTRLPALMLRIRGKNDPSFKILDVLCKEGKMFHSIIKHDGTSYELKMRIKDMELEENRVSGLMMLKIKLDIYDNSGT